jgi:hypothetical protein
MGFHIYINCFLGICEDTGKHFYYRNFQKVYDMPPVVPEEHREFINMKGKVFRIYTDLITDDTSTSVTNFIDKYPEWFDIVEDSNFESCSEYWNEEKHNRFYAALKWFSDQDISYTISWNN